MSQMSTVIISRLRTTSVFLALMCMLAVSSQAQQQCLEDNNVWEDSWVSCLKVINPNPVHGISNWIAFEFDQAEAINDIWIWNANRTNESQYGIKDMVIDYSEDGVTWISLGSFVLPQADESATYAGVKVTDMGGQFAKKILITAKSSYTNIFCVSLSEVRFDIDHTACYGTKDVCGVCDGPGEISWYADTDGDGLGDPTKAIIQCNQPPNYVDNDDDQCDNGLYGWDVMGALFEDNGCTGCHGNNGSGGLSLTSYDAMIAGGNKCGPGILTPNNLVGVITTAGFVGCGTPIRGNSMNSRVGGAMDSDELAMIQSWINSGAPEYCACPVGSPDSDGDGHCDAIDFCPGFDNDLIGTACDDGLVCTIDDRYNDSCNCEGTPTADSDQDGICDATDQMPNDPCTADGVLGLPEPAGWTALPTNDCDGDGITVGVGDLDDLVPCIDENGYDPTPSCFCPAGTMTAGGTYVSNVGVPNRPELAGGLANGQPSGVVGNFDELVIEFPYLEIGEVICFTIGFNDVDGAVKFNVNGLGNYFFDNVSGDTNYSGYEYCFEVFQEGVQTVAVSRSGKGTLVVDGSRYNYCPCAVADPAYNTPSCQCSANTTTGSAVYSSAQGINNPANAGGVPDGTMTGSISGNNDILNLTTPDMEVGAEICLTVGFSSGIGRVDFDVNGSSFYIYNQTGDANFEPQQLCFTASSSGPQAIKIQDGGLGVIRVDGLTYSYCTPCTPQSPDTDMDGICDQNDVCPDSALNDSDHDGICDDLDICAGSNDTIDSDGDGIPNGCDICPGFDDAVDTDGDNVSDGCDVCAGFDDAVDSDGDGIPDGCDNSPCLNFIAELTYDLIRSDRRARINIQSNGIIQPANNISYRAGTSIVLKESFEVKLGAIFLADIEACN